jgi:hypothetical protein
MTSLEREFADIGSLLLNESKRECAKSGQC